MSAPHDHGKFGVIYTTRSIRDHEPTATSIRVTVALYIKEHVQRHSDIDGSRNDSLGGNSADSRSPISADAGTLVIATRHVVANGTSSPRCRAVMP
jgi:hypothetical protein